MVEKLKCIYLAMSLVDIPAVSMPDADPSKLETSVAKLHILKWPIILCCTRCTCVMIILFNQLLDMPHLLGR
jgi:hypothetical protein